MMLGKRELAACFFAAALGQTPIAAAGSISGQIGVQIVIEPSCMIRSGSTTNGGVEQWGTLSFGTHSDLTTPKAAQTIGVSSGNFEVQCSEGLTTAALNFDGGLREAADGSQYMQNADAAAAQIAYGVYADAAYMNRLARGTAVQSSGEGNSSTNTKSYVFYGRVMPQEQSTVMPAAGTYTDTLQFTLSW